MSDYTSTAVRTFLPQWANDALKANPAGFVVTGGMHNEDGYHDAYVHAVPRAKAWAELKTALNFTRVFYDVLFAARLVIFGGVTISLCHYGSGLQHLRDMTNPEVKPLSYEPPVATPAVVDDGQEIPF